MVNIVNISNNDTIGARKYSTTLHAKNLNASKNQSFYGKKEEKEDNLHKVDKILPNDVFSKFKYNLNKTVNIPLVHFPRGLLGAQDYTFFEFLQTAKFPYYVGGPVLAALFYAGVKHDKIVSGKAAKNVAKHMALGVGLYYVAAMLAKGIINANVRINRGLDLNHPYQKAIPATSSSTGVLKKQIENHGVYESCEFTRWDVIYEKGDTPEQINKRYNKMGKKYGIKKDTDDADGTLKHLIKKTIIMSRAWKYALTALFVPIGIGIANQKAWEVENPAGFKNLIKNGIFGKGLKLAARKENLKTLIKDYATTPFKESCKQFWRGNNKTTSILGKSFIITAAAATILANILILAKTSARNYKISDDPGNKIRG